MMKNNDKAIDEKLEEIKQELQELLRQEKIAASSERLMLCNHLKELYGKTLASRHNGATYPTPLDKESIGRLRSPDNQRVLLPDIEILKLFQKKNLEAPSFFEAGPYEKLAFEPQRLQVAILTSGGVAPGLNAVIHELVKRHETYSANTDIFGIKRGFVGLLEGPIKECAVFLTKDVTQSWIHLGGSELGVSREERMMDDSYVKAAVDRLHRDGIGILYVIGGDGSIRCAHSLAKEIQRRNFTAPLSVIGIPKTMDNDLLWCWETFGFETAVNEAARIIRSLYYEVKATNRICIIQLFGAKSGFVASFAALASGVTYEVLVPEKFKTVDLSQPPEVLRTFIKKVFFKPQKGKYVLKPKEERYGLLVVAEGVKPTNVKDRDEALESILQWTKELAEQIDPNEKIEIISNQPRHQIRAVPPTPTDLILCRRLASLAVDCALAGYYDFMISQHLTEYVMVPLSIVGTKEVTLNGMFWKLLETSLP